MKNFTKTISFLSFIIISASCSKEIVKAPEKTKIQGTTTSAISPESGITFTAVTITGNNFDTVKANNIVKFNGTTAIVNSATPTQIVATVPPGATTGKVTLITNGKTVNIATAFKVLQLVKTDSIGQSENALVSLFFDKNNNMFGIKNSGSSLLLVKYANGTLRGTQTPIYRSPDDTTTVDSSVILPGPGNSPAGPGGSGYPSEKFYNYTLTAPVTDNQGNIYITQQFQKDTTSPKLLTNQESLNSSILKITPSGKVAVLKSISGGIAAMTIDPSGNIYFVVKTILNLPHYSYSIYKITSTGVITSFAGSFAGTASFITSMAIDKLGNVYVANTNIFTDQNTSIVKFTPQGTNSGVVVIGSSLLSNAAINWMFFDASNNLIAGSNLNILVINSAGYVGAYLNPPNENGLFIDPMGNWYQATEFQVTKYSFK